MEKLSEAASRVVIARPRRGRGNLGKALPEWERHRRPYTPPDLTVAAFPAQPLAALPPYGCGVPLAGCERLAGCRFGGTPPTAPALVGERHAAPGDALAICTNRRQNSKRSRLVIPRSEATWESPATGHVFAEAYLLSDMVLRDCHVGRWPPRNDKADSLTP